MDRRTGGYVPSDASSGTAGPGRPPNQRLSARIDSAQRAASQARGPIRIALVDDNRMARDHLATVLNRQPRFKIVAKAASAAPEPADVQERWPNVAQVDAVLCTCDTDQCLERARQAAPEARLVVMGVRPGKTDVIGLIRAGAHGFILRNASEAAVVGTIQTVAQGTDVLPAPLTSVLWSHLTTRPTTSPPPASPEADASLTKREREVAGLILEGLPNKEIGRRLGISTHTVKSHVHNLLDKSGLRTRMEVSAHTWRA